MSDRNVKRRAFIIAFLIAVAILTGVVSISVGTAGISPALVGKVLLSKTPLLSGFITERSWNPAVETIVWDIRLPRAILAAVIGAALAGSGVIFQALFKNPMADPYVVGVSSGAGFGASLAAVAGISFSLPGISSMSLMALAGALGAVALVYNIAKVGNRIPVVTLLLAGVALSTFLSSGISFLMVVAGDDVHGILFWLMGGLSSKGWEHVWMVLPYVTVSLLITLILVGDLNLLLMGEEQAHHLGLNVEAAKKVFLITGCIMAAASVSVAGIIGFVGLITPHLVRLAAGPDHKILLPASVLTGAIFLQAADTLSRVVMAPAELPIGIITAVIGGPFFIYLLWRKKSEMF